MNPPECVWGILNHIITKTILQEKVRIHYRHYNLVHKFISYASSYENSSSKSSSGQGMGKKLEKISAWNLTKVKSKKTVIDEARDGGRYSSFCIINGHMSSEKC